MTMEQPNQLSAYLKNKNIQIAKNIKDVIGLHEADSINTTIELCPKNEMQPNSTTTRIELTHFANFSYYSWAMDNWELSLFQDSLKKFSLPLSLFKDCPRGFDSTVTTPYGWRQTFGVTKSGAVWQFRNIYFFDYSGNSLKYEKVWESRNLKSGINVEEFMEDFADVNDIMPAFLEIEPDERDSRFIPLKIPEYEKISPYLKEAAEGNFAPIEIDWVPPFNL